MKYNLSDLRLAQDNARINRQQGNDANAIYWELRVAEISKWLEAKKARAAHRKELKKAGLWTKTAPVIVTPTPVSPDSIFAPKLDWDAQPIQSLIAFTNMVLAAEDAQDCQVQVAGHKAVSYYNPGKNFIRFSHVSISYLKFSPFHEYATVRHVWTGYINNPGKNALILLALHEAAHAIQHHRLGYCTHHDKRYQAVLAELAQKYGPKPEASFSTLSTFAFHTDSVK